MPGRRRSRLPTEATNRWPRSDGEWVPVRHVYYTCHSRPETSPCMRDHRSQDLPRRPAPPVCLIDSSQKAKCYKPPHTILEADANETLPIICPPLSRFLPWLAHPPSFVRRLSCPILLRLLADKRHTESRRHYLIESGIRY